jgi:hypothetical protein
MWLWFATRGGHQGFWLIQPFSEVMDSGYGILDTGYRMLLDAGF